MSHFSNKGKLIENLVFKGTLGYILGSQLEKVKTARHIDATNTDSLQKINDLSRTLIPGSVSDCDSNSDLIHNQKHFFLFVIK